MWASARWPAGVVANEVDRRKLGAEARTGTQCSALARATSGERSKSGCERWQREQPSRANFGNVGSDATRAVLRVWHSDVSPPGL